MSAEEATDTPAAAPVAVAGEEKKEGGKNGARPKREEVPIEELFDLSKPIPNVRRP